MTHGNLPGMPGVLLRGALLGLAVTVLGSCLFAVAILLLAQLDTLSQGPVVRLDNLLAALLILVVYVAIALVFAVVPGTIGGGMIALILHRQMQRQFLPTGVVWMAGLLVGLGAGFVTAEIVHLRIGPEGERVVTGGHLWTNVTTMGIGALCGLVHSRWMSNWLKARMK
jgi:hypothetical protein